MTTKPQLRRREAPTPVTTALPRCRFDGALLEHPVRFIFGRHHETGADLWETTGYCPTGGGYPYSPACPFLCPVCQYRRLGWEGDCLTCHGSLTPQDRTTWTSPGDYYEYQASHFVRTAIGPRTMPSAEEIHEALAACRRAIQHITRTPEATP